MDNWASAMIGRYILIVEDDYLIATDMAVSLEAMGAHILGPAASVRDALDIVEGALHLDGAAVDLKLRDGMAFPVAEALLKRGTPFVFATAYDEAAIPARFGKIVACPRPVNSLQITHALLG
jgi:CheY-like chemotaxis protein